MVASSILPVTIINGKLYFLFGKENELEHSAKGFSDFGGRVEAGESIIDTAYREGSEELCGFLGGEEDIKALVEQNGGFYKLSYGDYHVHIFYMTYDANLTKYFTNQHHFLWNRMDKQMLNNSKLFEKQEIRWFSIEDMKSRQNEFRSFYYAIVKKIFAKLSSIRKFIMSKSKMSKSRSFSRNKTQKRTRNGKGG